LTDDLGYGIVVFDDKNPRSHGDLQITHDMSCGNQTASRRGPVVAKTPSGTPIAVSVILYLPKGARPWVPGARHSSKVICATWCPLPNNGTGMQTLRTVTSGRDIRRAALMEGLSDHV